MRLPRRQIGRMDRYVRRGHLSLSPAAPRQKLASLVEESLRLCSLPGEAEGRVYYLRRLHLEGLPENGERGAWLVAFQNAIEQQASQAIHGSDPRAARADAVYFHNEGEACETLLLSIARRVTPTAWFWSHPTGQTGALRQRVAPPALIASVIEKLLGTPAGWMAAATVMLSVIRQSDAVTLLKLLPDETVGRWLSELGGHDPAHAAPLRFSESVSRILMSAIRALGPEAPAVLWLASLAVIRMQPTSGDSGSAVRIARSSLRKLLADSTVLKASMDDSMEASKAPVASSSVQAAAAKVIPQHARGSAQPIEPLVDGRGSTPETVRNEFCFGEPTSGAGLYFFLNALRYLRIQEQDFSPLFLARLFLRIARHSK